MIRVNNMTRIKVSIPEGVSGDFEIAHYTNQTTDKDWQEYLKMKNENHEEYCVLLSKTCPMPLMQDSTAEYEEHRWLWENAVGHVFIGGLGIGMVNEFLMNSPHVTAVTIIENSQDVIDLVWPHCAKDDTFTLVKADIETWVPPKDTWFDTMWFDTWLVDNPLGQIDYIFSMISRYKDYTRNMGFWGGK